MILFTREEARDFRALFGRCVSGRPRGPATPVLIRFADEMRTIASMSAEGVLLTHTSDASGVADDLLVLPGSVLSEVEGSTTEGVTLERQSKFRAVVRWHGGSKPRTLPIELILPGKQHGIPAPPELSPVSDTILAALQECGRTAARENGRFALSKVQVQGRAGRVTGTDGKVALLGAGFEFPFTDDVLVPALPVFNSKPLTRQKRVLLGRTSTQLVIAAGPWAIWLPIESKARYPDVAALIPQRPASTAHIDDTDAIELLKVLSGLPGHDEVDSPITIDFDSTVTIRGRDEKASETREVTLRRSRVQGAVQRVAFNRRILARGLSLGCRTLNATPGKPMVVAGENFSLIALPLDAACVAPHTAQTRMLAATTRDQPTPTSQGNEDMPTPDTNGHTPVRGDPPDPLLVAEELRASLTDATTKAARLVAVLKVGRKEKKVLATLYAGLKQLNLEIPNGPP